MPTSGASLAPPCRQGPGGGKPRPYRTRPTKLVDNARKLLLQTERDLPKIRDAIADKLLSVCNENWREEKRPISRTAFKRQLSPISMHTWLSGLTLYRGSSDLFLDHGVEVRLCGVGG